MKISHKTLYTTNDNLKYLVLSLLSESSTPIGSGMLCEMLLNEGVKVGESKISRMLRRMDTKNLTKRVGYQGRVITKKGREYVKEIANKIKHNQSGIELIKVLEESEPEELYDILVVRKVLEKEAARLAAKNATEQDVQRLEEILMGSKQIKNDELHSAEQDMLFHETIAEISGNRILKSTLNLLVTSRNLHPVFGHIRRRVGSILVTDHEKIINAIKAGCEKKAEIAMENHIETVIDDVRKYFHMDYNT